jgi:hypothetical protein
VLVEYIFVGGVLCLAPCRMALDSRAAADWRSLGVFIEIKTFKKMN